MLKTIFTKTLYEKRWMTFWWMVVTLLLIVAIVALFPLFRDSLSITAVPESLQSLVGDANAYGTITGWLNFQVFDQMVFIGIILGIIVGGSLLAGEEKDGTLQNLLALPVSRSRVYLQKGMALVGLVGVVTLCLLAGCVIGLAFIGESVGWRPLVGSTLMAFLLSLFFAALTYAMGAITGKRGFAGTFVGLYAFAGFMISSLAAGISALKYVDYFSPFRYYNKPSPFDAGFQTMDALVLTTAVVVFLVVGLIVFTKRDIYR